MKTAPASSNTHDLCVGLFAFLWPAVVGGQESGMQREEPTADTETNDTWFKRRYNNA